jgi:uncharacterized protein (DUF2147 family)
MPRSNLLFAIPALLLASSQVCAETASGPTGTWLTQAGDAKIRINHCGTTLCGTIVWLKVPIDPATGKPQIDDKNPNPALAKRAIIGLNIFSGMKPVTDKKWSGTIYNADDGKTYSTEVMAAGPKLEVHGCVMAFLCGSETWTKVGDVAVADANN